MNWKRWTLLLVVSVFSVTSLMAQTASTGALTGTVKDPSGAVIPNATVTLTSADTGQTRTATTTADGTYKFSLLPPGNYGVRIEASGFKPVQISSVTVNVTQTEVLDRNLEVGTQAQAVTVEGEVEAVQTTSSAIGTIANARSVVELPLNTRNYTNLLALSSGVAANVSNATTIGKGATNMAVNGSTTGENTYLQDGVPINNWSSVGGVSEGPQIGSFAMPNPDAIAEFKIQTSTYDAGYGRNPGANVNVITKSGTNNFHGSAFEFFRNTALNANDWFLNRQGLPKPALNSNVYGGSFGGPVKKDKLFFFVSYQEIDQKNGLSAFSQETDTVPPIPNTGRGTCGPVGWTTIASCDAAGAAFVQTLATNMCSSKLKTKGSVGIICPGAPNPDPVSAAAGLFNINPIAISALQLAFPGGAYQIPGSGTSKFATQTFVTPALFKDHQGIGNVDYVFNSKHTFSGRYIYEADPLNAPFASQNSQEQGNAVPGDPLTSTHTNDDAIAKLTSILSNNVVNEFHVAYQRNGTRSSQNIVFHDSQIGAQDFFSPFYPAGAVDNLSFFHINGSGSTGQFWFGYHPTYTNNTTDNQYLIGDQVSWTHGKHTMRAGFEVERLQEAYLNQTSSVAQPSYKTFADFLIGREGSCGAAVAPTPANPAGCNGSSSQSNVGSVGGSSTANGIIQTDIRILELSGFVQDDIKVNARFTLNAGLRWEYDGYPTDPDGGKFSNLWPSLVAAAPAPIVTVPGGPGSSLAGYIVPSNYTGIIPAGVQQNSVPFYTPKGAPWHDFAPRLGFAWQPTSSNRLVLRGGVGYFYDVLGGHDVGRLDQTNPIHGTSISGPAQSLFNMWAIPPGLVFAGPNTFGFTPRWVDPSTVVKNPATPCIAPPCSSSLNPTTFDQNMTVPVTYQWNMNVQYEFLRNWVMEIGYVGSRGIHQATPGAVQMLGADGSPTGSPYNVAQLVGVGAPCASCVATGVTTNTTQNAVLRVPYLGISPTASQNQTNSNYTYNSLQVTLRKQFSKGLQLQAAYSFSRGFEQAPQGINTYPYVIQTYSPEYFVRPQRLVVSYVWDLPLGHQKGLVGKLTDGWSWSGVTVIQNGAPINLYDSSEGTIFGQTGNQELSHVQLCPGMTSKDELTTGSVTQRISNGLNGGDGWINSAAFCAPSAIGNGTGFGNGPTGNILGPGQSNWDMSFAKLIKIRETQSLEFRAEFFNTFNHPQFQVFLNDSDVSDRLPADGGNGGLGTITSSSVNPRVIQLALKFLF